MTRADMLECLVSTYGFAPASVENLSNSFCETILDRLNLLKKQRDALQLQNNDFRARETSMKSMIEGYKKGLEEGAGLAMASLRSENNILHTRLARLEKVEEGLQVLKDTWVDTSVPGIVIFKISREDFAPAEKALLYLFTGEPM